jgi:pilus assembly protein Flp/PilA
MTRTYVHLLALMTFVSGRFEDREDRGATAVEYGLLVGLIAVVLVIAVGALGGDISALFTRLSADVDGIAP